VGPQFEIEAFYSRGLPDPIASVFLLLLLFGEQIDYLLSVWFLGHTF
jgi:hypothetical protein